MIDDATLVTFRLLPLSEVSDEKLDAIYREIPILNPREQFREILTDGQKTNLGEHIPPQYVAENAAKLDRIGLPYEMVEQIGSRAPE